MTKASGASSRLLIHEADHASTYDGPAVLVQGDRRTMLSHARVHHAGMRQMPAWRCTFQCRGRPWPEPGEGMLELPGYRPVPVVVETAEPGAVVFSGGAMLAVTGRLRFAEGLPRAAFDPRRLRM